MAADAAEGEVELGLGGGVEVDRADAEDTLAERLGRVDVLDALQAGLMQVPREDPRLDRQPLVGDRVGGAEPPQLPDREQAQEHHRDGGDHPAGLHMAGGDRRHHPGHDPRRHRREQASAEQAGHRQP